MLGGNVNAECHPDRPVLAKGLCAKCYDRVRYKRNFGNQAYKRRLIKMKQRYRDDAEFRERKLTTARKCSPHKARARGIFYRYGITYEEYEVFVKLQDGVCKICKKFKPSKRFSHLSVDHCHKTSKVRGLLCSSCNAKLGWLENKRDIIEEYLR